MWILILLVPFSLLALLSCVVLGGPRRYSVASLGLALLLLWAWLGLNWWAGAAWFVLFGGIRLGLAWDYPRRLHGTVQGATGRARYLSFLPREDGRRPLAVWLPPLKTPLYWVVRRLQSRLPGPVATGMNGMPAGTMLLPMLNQIFGQSRGFRLDTRHLPSQKGPAMEIRCD
jgi:hypothetical protein